MCFLSKSVMQALHQIILDNQFVIVRRKDVVWRRQESERFYAEHSGAARICLYEQNAMFTLVREHRI